jgi:hypothetical protein
MVLFKECKYSQSEVVAFTKEMRDQSKTDEEIIRFLGLKNQVPWQQDLAYLKPLFAFATSIEGITTQKPFLTEAEQRERAKDRDKW